MFQKKSSEIMDAVIRSHHEASEQSAPDIDVLPHVLIIRDRANETKCVRNFLILSVDCYYEIDSGPKAVQYCFECIWFLKPIFGKDIYGKTIGSSIFVVIKCLKADILE